MKKILALLLSVMMVLTLCVGCTKPEPTPPAGNDPEPTPAAPAEPKVIVTTISNDPDTFDTALYGAMATIHVLRNIQEGLVKNRYQNGAYELIPGDAESWEVSADGLDYTFHIRADAKWSDGEPITAQQYVYGIQRIVDPNNAGPQAFMIDSLKNYAKCITGELPVTEIGAKALDERTLVLTLESPFSGFLQTICGSIVFPVREEFITNWGERYGSEAQYIGFTGPFIMDEWIHNSKIVLKKNPNYWNKDTVYLDRVEYMITNESNTIYSAYQAGDINICSTTTKEWIDLFRSDPHNKEVIVDSSQMMVLFFNCADPIFKNVNIRRAFSLVTNAEEFNNVIYDGARRPLYGVVTEAVGTFRKLAGDPLKEVAASYAAQGVTPKDLLLKGMQELGLGSDPKSLDITLKLGSTTDWARDFTAFFKQKWDDALGTDVKLSMNNWGIFADDYTHNRFQIGQMSWTGDYADPYATINIFTTIGNSMSSNWNNAEFDALVNQAKAEQDEAKRTQLYIQAEKMIMEDCVLFPLCSPITSYFYKDYITGYNNATFMTTGFQFVDIQK